jgi:hypothetical protein
LRSLDNNNQSQFLDPTSDMGRHRLTDHEWAAFNAPLPNKPRGHLLDLCAGSRRESLR